MIDGAGAAAAEDRVRAPARTALIVAMSEWLRVARRRDVVSRSTKVGLMVGTILVVINYGDRLLTGSILPIEWAKMVLTYCVPYCVSTYASVSAVLAARET